MMGESPILRVIARYAAPISILVALRIFWQGHDNPGGGFIAGVLLAASGVIYMLAFGSADLARVAWWRVAVVGLLIGLCNGVVPLLRGGAFLDNTVLHLGPLHVPTATIFDLGVMLVVVGTLMTIFVELSMERRR